MKYLLTFFCFFLCISASAQLLKKESHNTQLPIYLSALEYQKIKENYTFKTNLKAHTFTIEQLDKMRRGDFIISTKNISKKLTYIEIPRIDLSKELNKIMYKVPGETGPIRPKGFTL